MRIVIKIGTQAIANGKGLEKKKLALLVKEIAKIIKKGHQVILVSSGAIGTGLPLLSFRSSHLKKVAASVGQPILMQGYIQEAKKYKIKVGQILVLSDDFSKSRRYKNFIENVQAMLAHRILPIVNENDVMKRGDLRIGDNDLLSAMVAVGIRAKKLIMLTNQAGLCDANPDTNPSAKLIKVVPKIDKKIESFCSKTKSNLGRGGMMTKIEAAKYATKNGVETLIGQGGKEGIISSVLGKNFIGTKFLVNK